MRIFWSTIAVFFDGLFWSLVLAVADLLTFLGQLLYTFHRVGRLVLEDTQQIPIVGHFEHEESTVAFKEEISQSQVEIPPLPAYPRIWAPDVKVSHRHFAADDRVGAPENVHVMAQQSLLVIACNVACHRTWRKFYAVVIGREPGIYKCWDCAKLQVEGVSGQLNRSFGTKLEAEAWFRLQLHCSQNHTLSHDVHRIIS